jgi:hypothetical protein
LHDTFAPWVQGTIGDLLKSTLILADAASASDDGTFSLLRGGISEVRIVPGQPVVFSGALVARLEASPEEKGTHDVSMRFQTDGGETVGKAADVKFIVGDTKQSVLNAVMSFHVPLPKLGRYEFSVLVDGKKINSVFLDAVTLAVAPEAKGAK